MIKIKSSNRNTNKHTQDGMELLENSINKVGVIESISVATDGTIISGHARKEIFDKQGKIPKEIKLEANEYPVILTDIENNTKQYFEAQILANTTANKNFDLDIEEIELISEEFDIDIEEMEVELKQNQELQKGNIIKENIKPFIQTHILLSFTPEKMIDIQEYIQKITEIQGVEYEQSSN